jgi:HK97 family phage portal protein
MRGLGELFTRSAVQNRVISDFGGYPTGGDWALANGLPWTTAGGYRGALSIPGVARATALISDLLAGLPWHAYRSRVGGPTQQLDVTPPLLERPCPPDTRVTTFSAWAMDLLLCGNAIGIFTARNAEGWPTACVPVPADQVSVRRVQRGDGIPFPVGSIAYQIGTGSSATWFASDDVLHVKGPCAPGALRGVGILENHMASTFDLAQQQTRWARNIDNAAVPTGVLRATDSVMDGDQARRLKERWRQSQRERTVAVISAGLEFTPVGWSPSDTQLLEARKFTLHEIALIFGLDVSWLGAAQTSRVYSNVEQEGINLVRYTLGGWLARFEQALSAAMPRGVYVKANVDGLMRADTKTRMETYEIAIRNGIRTRDEVRELEELPPLTPKQRAELTPAPQEKTAPPMGPMPQQEKPARLADKRRPA